MTKSMLHDANSSFLGRAQLMKLRLKAIRSGMWFRSLSRIDRVLVDLTIKVAGTVRSSTLARNIRGVIGKLEGIMESRFLRTVKEVGVPIARRLCLIAREWGNTAAKEWESDEGFAKYLAAMSINEPMLFRGC